MNSTSFIESEIVLENSTIIHLQSWFIPVDIRMIVSTALVIILSILFLFTIILDKTCHTIPMMLVANSCLSALLVGCVTLGMSLFSLENDRKQIRYQDSLCVIRAYIGYALYGILNFSFFLQGLYQYIIVVYPNRLFWQSSQVQVLGICLTWIFGFVYPVPFLVTGAIVYNVDNQICLQPLTLSFSLLYGAFCAYMMPISLLIFIYLKLVQHVKQIGKNVTVANTLVRAQRELKMVRRIVILVAILITVCFPYTLVMLMSFFNSAPKYHFRISCVFLDAAILSAMIALFQFTDPLKASLMKRVNVPVNMVEPTMT